MKRTWLAGLAVAFLFVQAASCTAQQDLGNRPGEGDGGTPEGGDGGANPPAPMRAFVTKSLFNGNLQAAARRYSGLEAGDAICQLAADGATLGGRWAAWLSDKNMDAIDRLDNDGPWVTLPGSYTGSKRIFLDRAGIGAGPIEDDTLTNEYGERCVGCDFPYRSGTSASGRATGNDCASWSTGSDTTASGECGAARLLCLEQKIAGYRKRVFVTSKTFEGNFANSYKPIEVADGLCGDAAKAANLGGKWRAWLSGYSDRSVPYRAFDRLASRADSWSLVDGTTIAFSSRAQLTTGPEHAIDHDEFNQPVDPKSVVWTGTTAKGTMSSDRCDDFLRNTTGFFSTVGIAGEASPKWTEAPNLLVCNQTARLYCFEQ